MRLSNIREKIKQFPDLPKDIFVLLVIILVAFGAFLTGRYSTQQENRAGDLKIVDNRKFINPIFSTSTTGTTSKRGVSSSSSTEPSTLKGMYVGSKSGKTYHLPWCSGAKRIREENKVWFESKSVAEARGYKPSASCKGI